MPGVDKGIDFFNTSLFLRANKGTYVEATRESGPIFQKEAFLKFVKHFVVEFVMQFFSHNSDMLISNLPHAKFYF